MFIDTIKNKLDYYRGKNCMKNFCLDLIEHATKLINYEKKEMVPLTKEEKRAHRIQRRCYICRKSLVLMITIKEIIIIILGI